MKGKSIKSSFAFLTAGAFCAAAPSARQTKPATHSAGSGQASTSSGQTDPTKPILHQINREVVRILSLPEVKERLQSYDFHVVTSTPEEYDKILRADIEVFRQVGKAAGLIAK